MLPKTAGSAKTQNSMLHLNCLEHSICISLWRSIEFLSQSYFQFFDYFFAGIPTSNISGMHWTKLIKKEMDQIFLTTIHKELVRRYTHFLQVLSSQYFWKLTNANPMKNFWTARQSSQVVNWVKTKPSLPGNQILFGGTRFGFV